MAFVLGGNYKLNIRIHATGITRTLTSVCSAHPPLVCHTKSSAKHKRHQLLAMPLYKVWQPLLRDASSTSSLFVHLGRHHGQRPAASPWPECTLLYPEIRTLSRCRQTRSSPKYRGQMRGHVEPEQAGEPEDDEHGNRG
ncbi:hypothetical protein EJ06DRAFT_36937 [Trichodelitschia bisporula]|uniref:Uncharacterized protein n=1 Tax=Trichodelitschia bisporula TaxID=703511 RepID=A0A6G1HV05_9PEZI|nr:hypothetical protein EJ06DRAFT_36937 [Trichodelitschia bisporula]